MDASTWFTTPVIGDMAPTQAIIKLREIGEFELAEKLERAELNPVRSGESGKWWWPFSKQHPWASTSHAFGYIHPIPKNDPQPILALESVDPDHSLQHARIKITLNQLRAAHYPGRGIHHILLHTNAQNQIADRIEPLHFSATYRVQEGERVGIHGYPIFIGLNVGPEGIVLKCRTINVLNERDEALLRFMESDTFKAGLQILTTAQPALALCSETLLGLARAIESRNRNVAVQDIELGLGFRPFPMSGCLAEGIYLAVQIPENSQVAWEWDEWIYLPAKGKIVKRTDHNQLIPYNYLAFGISRYEAERQGTSSRSHIVVHGGI
ncbi:hypothetical protein [Dictyobacter aurantiacus]|uniref:Uncharacterized protein n=1 Tax=Dictyobacter aurantiacus TaxID=1936993 RepID=A0A401ZG44_9CHLR|nr:hypothetical protein [Dictyobacter aurantiacus]GCE05845.1 hypothetical protein KDAU_31740 [Dictyobacter aurantiacus]